MDRIAYEEWALKSLDPSIAPRPWARESLPPSSYAAIKADAPRSFLFSIRGESEVKSLEMGNMTAKDVPVIVLDHPLLKAMGDMLNRPLDGIIGYTLFNPCGRICKIELDNDPTCLIQSDLRG